MNKKQNEEGLKRLVATYFSDPAKRLKLEKGDVLLEEGAVNDRLYLVLQGSFIANNENIEDEQQQLFLATKDMFIGVISFFSRSSICVATIVAKEDCEVAFIDHNQRNKAEKEGLSLIEQFMPVVVFDLFQRQQREQQIIFEKEHTLEKLYQAKKLASLGQMAAGIAHELNNAIAVVSRNASWLNEHVGEMFLQENEEAIRFFQMGSETGQSLSSREIRVQAKALQNKYDLDEDAARKLAEINVPSTIKLPPLEQLNDFINRSHRYWELGASFHDLNIAAKHASHVVGSVKALAAGSSGIHNGHVSIQESIDEALTLLSSPLRTISVRLKIRELPDILANKGELVQVWTNLIKNAIDSLKQSGTESPEVYISAKPRATYVSIRFQDNGPGIAKEEQGKIFQPNFTTKEKGLDFGLGLGLTICERIIGNYGGEISVKSRPGKTVFKIKLPL